MKQSLRCMCVEWAWYPRSSDQVLPREVCPSRAPERPVWGTVEVGAGWRHWSKITIWQAWDEEEMEKEGSPLWNRGSSNLQHK